MRCRTSLAAAVLLALGPGVNLAEEQAYSGDVSVNYIYVENPNEKFSEYNGLTDRNNIAVSVDASGLDPEAPEKSWKFDIHNLGLDTFFVEGEYKKQGHFAIRGGYEELLKIYHDGALTVFDDAGNMLALPRLLTTETTRKTASAGFDVFFRERFKFTTDVRSQNKEGQRPRPIQPASYILPQEIDFRHNEIEAMLSYSDDLWSWRLGSRFSEFDNDNKTVLNHAAEPNNDFYQLFANGSYRLTDTSKATAYLSYSKASQDEDFNNYAVTVAATDSANAEYSNVNFRLGYRNRLTRKLSFDAKYRYESRDNDTSLYDGFASNKNNIVYEWDKQKLDLEATYRLPQRWRLRGGVTWEDNDRTSLKEPVPSGSGFLTQYEREVNDETTEWTGWGQLRTPQIEGFNGQLKLAYSDRSADLDPVREEAATVDTNGVALSSYLDDRKRTEIDLLLNQVISKTVTAGFNVRHVDEDYAATAWNSLDSIKSTNYSINIDFVPRRDYTLAFYVGVENHDIDQSGFGSLSNPSTAWNYSIEDATKLFGVTVKALGISGFADLKVDYSYQDASGKYETLDPSNVSGPFPDLESTINRLRVDLDFHIDKRLTINAQYRYENYDIDNWAWKQDFGVAGGYFDTLNYGYDTPSESTHMIGIGLTYRF